VISRPISRPISRSISRAIAGSANADAGFLSLDFVSNTYNSSGVKKQFGELIEFRRPSGGGIWNAQGNFEWLGTDVPRFNYDSVSGKALGLLVEPQSTNLVSGYTVSAGFEETANPRIAGAAWKLTSKPSSGAYSVRPRAPMPPVNPDYAVSTFAWLASGAPVVSGTNVQVDASFTLIINGGSGTENGSKDLGRGLYRLSTARNISAGQVATHGLYRYPRQDGELFSSVGLQIEAPQLTSYIPTTTAQVTRAADNVFIPNGTWRSPNGRLEVDADEGVTVTLETGGIRIAGLGHIRSLKFYPEAA